MIPAHSSQSELHHFSDASELAYGSCTYVRSVLPSGEITISLVMSKSRVAPLKRSSVPRLELEAAVLSAKVDALLKHEMNIEFVRSVFWFDSEIILRYISN